MRATGAFFLAAPLWALDYLVFPKAVSRTPAVRAEAGGSSYDPGMGRWVAPLSVAELIVFWDCGHWRLVPWPENVALRSAGLML